MTVVEILNISYSLRSTKKISCHHENIPIHVLLQYRLHVKSEPVRSKICCQNLLEYRIGKVFRNKHRQPVEHTYTHVYLYLNTPFCSPRLIVLLNLRKINRWSSRSTERNLCLLVQIVQTVRQLHIGATARGHEIT